MQDFYLKLKADASESRRASVGETKPSPSLF